MRQKLTSSLEPEGFLQVIFSIVAFHQNANGRQTPLAVASERDFDKVR